MATKRKAKVAGKPVVLADRWAVWLDGKWCGEVIQNGLGLFVARKRPGSHARRYGNQAAAVAALVKAHKESAK